MIWPHASAKNPCPVCGKTDWCSFGDKAVLCQRIESNRPHPKGGWYHPYGEKSNLQVTNLPKARPAPTPIQAVSMMRSIVESTHDASYHVYAQKLGVSYGSLKQLGCGYSARHSAWAFPMSDGADNYIGIRLRNDNGKWAVPGGQNGLFVPNCEPQSPVYLPEGPTSTAAVLSMGLFAIGRPNNKCGAAMIMTALKTLGIYRAVIMAENDELKMVGSKEERAGSAGAFKLKRDLAGIASCIWWPPAPIKDAREFYQKGGTKEMIESEIKSKIWTK